MSVSKRHERLARAAMGALALSLAAPRVARAQSQDAADAVGAGVVADLAEPLRVTVPETFGDRSAVGVRVTGSEPPEALERVLRSVERALGAERRAVPLSEGDDLAGAVRAARSAGTPRLLRVELTTERGALRASASLHVVDPGPWRAFLAAEALAPAAVATVQRDASSAPAPTAPRWPTPGRAHTVATPFRGTVALALADLDGDGRDEVVIVTSDRVRVARLAGSSLAFVRDAPGNPGGLARAAVPLRQALGSVDGDAARRVVRFRTSQYAAMGELRLVDGAAQVRSLGVDLYPAQGVGCVALRAGTDAVAGVVASCDASPPAPVEGSVAAVPVAYEQVTADGARHRWELRTSGAGAGELRRDGVVFAALADIAAPAVLDDLDGDGRVELVAASASSPGSPDRVRVFSLADRAEERPGVSVPGSVEALATGDLDGDGRRELVVSVHDPLRRTSTLWIIR